MRVFFFLFTYVIRVKTHTWLTGSRHCVYEKPVVFFPPCQGRNRAEGRKLVWEHLKSMTHSPCQPCVGVTSSKLVSRPNIIRHSLLQKAAPANSNTNSNTPSPSMPHWFIKILTEVPSNKTNIFWQHSTLTPPENRGVRASVGFKAAKVVER